MCEGLIILKGGFRLITILVLKMRSMLWIRCSNKSGNMISRKASGFCRRPNGKEAYQLYIQYSPELVMTDIRMPGMDGLELSESDT